MEQVIRALLAAGFEADGTTESETVKLITRNSYPLPGKLATFGGRQRYRRGDWRVTVGPRVVFFYKPSTIDRGVACMPTFGRSHRFKTSQIEAIRSRIAELE
jgi:hypothetical protein